MIPYETVLAPSPGYESHYLKANSPDGQRAFWVKHTLTSLRDGTRRMQLWRVRFIRGVPPEIWTAEVDPTVLGEGPTIVAPGLTFGPSHAKGPSWDLQWSGGTPIIHLPRPLYRLPTAKVLTPAAGAIFSGAVGDWTIHNWVGLRGHNWGRRHTHRYTWLAASEGVPLEGFIAQPRPRWPTIGALAGARRKLWFASLNAGRFEFGGVVATAAPEDFVTLDYLSPEGGTTPCRCTKFADVTVDGRLHSRSGELEFMGF